MLLLGRPGTGKSTLARAIAAEMDTPFEVVHAPTIKDGDELAQAALRAAGGILFVDEIHALNRQHAESLFTLVDDGTITVQRPVIGEGWEPVWIENEGEAACFVLERPYATPGMYLRRVEAQTSKTAPERVIVGSLTLVGATTDEALLPEAFLSRLSRLMVRLRPYTEDELARIGAQHAQDELDLVLDPQAANLLAARARQSPRKMKQLTERAADLAVGERAASITQAHAERALAALGVDAHGLEPMHRAVLQALAEAGNGLSRTSLGQKLGLPARNLQLYWQALMEDGLVTIDTRHRITDAGKAVLA